MVQEQHHLRSTKVVVCMHKSVQNEHLPLPPVKMHMHVTMRAFIRNSCSASARSCQALNNDPIQHMIDIDC
jgi:hypothetical protein